MLTDDQRVSPAPPNPRPAAPSIFMDCLGSPGTEEYAPINDYTCFHHQLTTEESEQNKVCFRTVKNCHTP